MDDNFKVILDTLAEKPPRSRLEPYGELIDELRRRGRTFREIARILTEKCQLQASRSRVHDFVRGRSRKNQKSTKRMGRSSEGRKATRANVTAVATEAIAPETNMPPADDVQQRIADLKRRPAPAQTSVKHFHYDPNEPFRRRPRKIERTNNAKAYILTNLTDQVGLLRSYPGDKMKNPHRSRAV